MSIHSTHRFATFRLKKELLSNRLNCDMWSGMGIFGEGVVP